MNNCVKQWSTLLKTKISAPHSIIWWNGEESKDETKIFMHWVWI